MTPADIVAAIHADLEPWARELRGVVSLAHDPYHFLELLATPPGGFVVAVWWAGDASAGSVPEAHTWMEHDIRIGVAAQLGLSLKPFEGLIKRRIDGAPALLTLVQLVNERVASHLIPGEACTGALVRRYSRPVTLPDSTPLRAYESAFSVQAASDPTVFRNA